MRILRWLLILLAVLVLLAALVWFTGPLYLKRSVAQYEGTAEAGVAAPVEISFDAKGIPQVWAKSDHDVYFTIGWLHASERLFQMELVRRLSAGELSEVFGEAAYETDEDQRRIGFARRARKAPLSAADRASMQRYVDGVNTWIAQANLLPPEFLLLRLKPRPWTVEDCLTVSYYQTWYSHQLMDQDRSYQELVERAGAPMKALTGAAHPWSPATVPDEFVESVLGATRMRSTAASNSWVVAPSRSASGAALHASDPHLAIDQAPGLWYLAGLHSEEGLDVVGVTYAGSPFVVMGHNGRIAFGFTVASVDLIDYYVDEPIGAPVIELIRVKGEKQPRRLEVRHGRRGVMIDETTSLHWAGFDLPDVGVRAAFELQRARSFDEFRRAVTRFGALDANWIYSDREGNIGYQLGAPIPVRDYDTYVRQRADDETTAWRGYRALDETPHALNPEQGYLASSNNQVVSSSWPYAIPGFYDPYRITRAVALLDGEGTVDRERMHQMQLDLVSALGLRWKSLAAEGAAAAGLNQQASMLSGWDGAMTSDSEAAALFAHWWERLPHALFEDELGEKAELGSVLVEEALTSGSPLIDDRRTPEVESVAVISGRAMREAVALANGAPWGEECTLVIRHPLARVMVLDKWLRLNRGPFPCAGDSGSLNANFHDWSSKSGMFRSRVGASMRFVLDWSDPDSFTLVGALGQSGNPLSPHYDDMLPLMLAGEAWNVPFSRARVEERQTRLLRLVPN